MQFYGQTPFFRISIPFGLGIVAATRGTFSRPELFFGASAGISLLLLSMLIKSAPVSFRFAPIAGLGIQLSLFFLAAQLRLLLSCPVFLILLPVAAFQIIKYIYANY